MKKLLLTLIVTTLTFGIMGGVSAKGSEKYTTGAIPKEVKTLNVDAKDSIEIAKTKKTFAPINFKDVPNTYWAYRVIQDGVLKGYVKGYDKNVFKPKNEITRAEFAVIIARILDVEGTTNPFPDTTAKWMQPSISGLVNAGVLEIKEYSKGFKPNEPITRKEMARIIAKSLVFKDREYESESIQVKDAKNEAMFISNSLEYALEHIGSSVIPVNDYSNFKDSSYYPHIALVYGLGIVNGYEDGTFRPDNKGTRAESISMLLDFENRIGKKSDDYNSLIKYLESSIKNEKGGYVPTDGFVPVNNEFKEKVTEELQSVTYKTDKGEMKLNDYYESLKGMDSSNASMAVGRAISFMQVYFNSKEYPNDVKTFHGKKIDIESVIVNGNDYTYYKNKEGKHKVVLKQYFRYTSNTNKPSEFKLNTWYERTVEILMDGKPASWLGGVIDFKLIDVKTVGSIKEFKQV